MSWSTPPPLGAPRIWGEGHARAPQPIEAYGLPAPVAAQLTGLALDPGRPLLAVDADEVLLSMVAPLTRFAETQGFRLALTEYRLDGALTRAKDGAAASRDELRALLGGFFETEAHHQPVVPGAAAALAELAASGVQVMVLTNAPETAKDRRKALLAGYGIDYPLVANSGGKGRALRYLWDHLAGPVAFIDDSDGQLASAAERAPGVIRAHFIADPALRQMTRPAADADLWAESWAALGTQLGAVLQTARSGD